MNARENLLSLVRRKGYEFAPVFFDLCPKLMEEFTKHTGIPPDPPDPTADYRARSPISAAVENYFGETLFPYADIPEPIPADRGVVDWGSFYNPPLKPGADIDRFWGLGYEHGSEFAVHMTYLRHPMEHFDSVEQAKAYPWPDWSGCDPAEGRKVADAIHAKGKAARGFMQMTIWEISWYLRSMENMMCDMLDEAPMAEYIFNKTTELAIQRAEYYARAGADVLFIGDDVGMQSRIMMSRDLYQTWVKPCLRRVVNAAKAINPDIIIDYHSCGYVEPLIPDLIEAGIEVLNPVQPECMPFEGIIAQFRGALSFRGTIGTQTTMPYGSPGDVKKLVWKNLDLAGREGGLLAMPTHILEPEVPWANIEAYVAACREYKRAGR